MKQLCGRRSKFGSRKAALLTLSVAAAVTYSGGVVETAQAAPSLPQAGCAQVILLGARGSGEQPTEGQGLGKEVFNFYGGLRSAFGSRLTSTEYAVPYTAADVQATLSVNKVEVAQYLAGGVLYTAPAYALNHLNPFSASIDDGISSAQATLAQVASHCPDAQFVLAGYSQGAMAWHKALSQMDAAHNPLLSRVAATVLIADGDRVSDTAANTFGSAYLNRNVQGIRTALTIGASDIPSSQASKTWDICDADDIVCNFDLVSYLAAGHKLLNSVNADIKIHTDTYGKSKTVTGVAAKVAATIQGPGAPVLTLSMPPIGVIGTAYSWTATAVSTSQLIWSASQPLPPGLTFSAAGVLAGSPTVAGSWTFDPTATDNLGAASSGTVTVVVSPSNANGLAHVSSGRSTACGITTSGGAKCWGYGGSGQLGNGGQGASSPTPVDVTGLSSGVVQISVGGDQTCAVTTAGAAKCWGLNMLGDLGDGTTLVRRTPVDVVGLNSGVAQLSAGYDEHTCALMTNGSVKCWGKSLYSDVAGNSGPYSTTPVDLDGFSSSVAGISVGGDHGCAVTTAGAAQCWGANQSGALGDGSSTPSTVPVDVVGLGSGVMQVSAGPGISCAVTTAGAAKCWGDNFNGDLGDGTAMPRRTPVDVTGLASGVTQISIWNGDACAVTAAGKAMCWGGSGYGELGNGASFNGSIPVEVGGLGGGVVEISPGYGFTCAATASGLGKCWGANESGQLGDGTLTNSSSPVTVIGLG